MDEDVDNTEENTTFGTTLQIGSETTEAEKSFAKRDRRTLSFYPLLRLYAASLLCQYAVHDLSVMGDAHWT
ncbi:hypothetical protein EVAR_51783_1 [Eumeta japonica]|uniref:Uncharacterized protein n=1 Tax=Eumeta variegata TaxID=151549 RepID=A0A4C1XB17_EUMVA|nr:hypothetical protein EVAR_51783_1 [Eumeta japonica]